MNCKKIYTLTSVSLLLVLLAIVSSCRKDLLNPLAKPVPLQMKLSSQSLVMGDELTIDIFVDDPTNPNLVTHEEIDVYLTAKAGTTDVASAVFENLPEKVIFPAGESKITLKVPVRKTGITKTYNFDLTAFIRGYKVNGATQSVIASDYHYTVVGVKNNPDKEIMEGDYFVLTAQVGAPAKEVVKVQLALADKDKLLFEDLPEELVIPAGGTVAESAPILLKKDLVYTGNTELTISFTSTSLQHPLFESSLIIRKKDIDAPLGPLMLDERWVYDNPDIPFLSVQNKAAVLNWYDKEIREMKIGDPHPKIPGWSFYNAQEFHAIPAAYANVTANAFGNFVPKGFAAQNTALVQTVMAINNDKYSTITPEGYMKMWAVKENINATGGASGMRSYGTAAFYSSKFADNNGNNVTFAPQHTRIYPGMRIEVRARIRGEKNGFNCAIWLQGNAQNKLAWPNYGEIDILENPVGPKVGTNVAFQTFHLLDQGVADFNPHSTQTIPKMNEWNIYWVELVDASTVKMGINGQETIELRKSMLKNPDLWPFDKVINPEGLHFLLTMGAPSQWGLGTPIPAGWDSAFADILYNDSKTNTRTPRMELDWVRYYTNAHYSIGDRKSAYTHNNIILY